MENLDILVSAEFLLTLEDENILTDAAVGIKRDTIVSVGKTQRLLKQFSPKRYFHYEHGLIMPGLINAHTHIPMTLFRGLADDLPLMTWLNKYIFPLEKKLKSEWVYWGALLGCAELIMSGTTCFCDMYLFADEVAKAADKAGLRTTVGEVLFDFPSPNYGPIEKGFFYTETLIKKWSNHPLISIAVEPHAVYTCSLDLLKQAKKMSEKYNVPYVIHLAETKAEVEKAKEEFHCTPAQHLANLGILDENVIANHCVWLTDLDIELIEKHQVKVVHNPESNLKLASGIAPVTALLSRDITVSLGTDGPASNNDLDMFLEMDTAAKVHKLREENPTLMPAWQVLAMATKEGAKTLGMDKKIGTITPGKKADLIVLDFNQPHLIPVYNPVSHLVYAASGKDVLTTIVNGKVLMENRKIKTLDLEEIYGQIKTITREFY